LHLIQSYPRVAQAGIADACCSAFLLGTVAPDAVAVHRDKHRTHYTIHAGLTWGYRFWGFEREFASYRTCSNLHEWFYRGYRYHLFVDDAWLRACGHRAVFRVMVGRLTGNGNGRAAQYYHEMSRFDAFHRSSADPSVFRDAYACLLRADLDLLPEFLDRDALHAMLEYLTRTASETSPRFGGRILRAGDIERFLQRVSELPIGL
jgi:hypothetical protein